MQLRYYQQEAINAVYQYMRQRQDNPCIVLPTGAGKTPVMANICNDAVNRWNVRGRVLVLAHVKELLKQTADTLAAITENVSVGVYSAGLKRRETEQDIIVAGIQSIYKNVFDFEPFDLVLVDECHLIPPAGDGMYRQCIADLQKVNPNVRVIGLTATPYRMSSGMVCGPDNILNEICYEIGVKELIVNGYLCPLFSKAGKKKPNTSKLHMRAGEFINSEVSELMDNESLVFSACNEIVKKTADRNSVLIFTSSIAHAEHVCENLRKLANADAIGLVTGKTSPGERGELLARFKGKIVDSNLFGEKRPVVKYLVNVNVLTTGFDATNIDCVVLLRPTASPGLYYQMVGRGFRLDESKKDCLVLDYGNNILRHGPVDSMTVTPTRSGGGLSVGDCGAKECPDCQSLIHSGYGVCSECGHVFTGALNANHEGSASDEEILSGVIEETEYEVRDVQYYQHVKRGAPEGAPTTLRVEYRIGFNEYQSEWICFEHTGFPRAKAEAWWRKRSYFPVPDTVEEALELAIAGHLAETKRITVRSVSGDDFDSIINYEFGMPPEVITRDQEQEPDDDFAWPEGWGGDDEVPF